MHLSPIRSCFNSQCGPCTTTRASLILSAKHKQSAVLHAGLDSTQISSIGMTSARSEHRSSFVEPAVQIISSALHRACQPSATTKPHLPQPVAPRQSNRMKVSVLTIYIVHRFSCFRLCSAMCLPAIWPRAKLHRGMRSTAPGAARTAGPATAQLCFIRAEDCKRPCCHGPSLNMLAFQSVYDPTMAMAASTSLPALVPLVCIDLELDHNPHMRESGAWHPGHSVHVPAHISPFASASPADSCQHCRRQYTSERAWCAHEVLHSACTLVRVQVYSLHCHCYISAHICRTMRMQKQ